nr:MAG TPA: hypothetical protein [Caudoviricetes sp.]
MRKNTKTIAERLPAFLLFHLYPNHRRFFLLTSVLVCCPVKICDFGHRAYAIALQEHEPLSEV